MENSETIREAVGKVGNGNFEIRYCFQNSKPYFMASDVVKCFGGYSSPATLTKLRVSPDDILKKDIYVGQGGSKKCLFIDERGVYSLIQYQGFLEETKREFVIWFKDIPQKLTDKPEEQSDDKASEPVKNIIATPFDTQMMKIGLAWGNFILDTLKSQRAAVATNEELEIALKATEMLLKNY